MRILYLKTYMVVREFLKKETCSKLTTDEKCLWAIGSKTKPSSTVICRIWCTQYTIEDFGQVFGLHHLSMKRKASDASIIKIGYWKSRGRDINAAVTGLASGPWT